MDVKDEAGLTDSVSTERSIKEEPETPREAPAPWEEQEEKPHLDQLHWRPPSNPHVKEEPSEELIERRPVGTGRQEAEEADHQRQRLILADAAAGRRPLKEECVTTNMFSSEKVINLQMDVKDEAGLTDCVSTERIIKEEPETPREAPAPWEEQEEKLHLDQLHWRPPINPHVKEEPSEELIERRPVGTGRQGAEEADHQRQRLIPADAAAGRRPLKEECVTTNMFSSEKVINLQMDVKDEAGLTDCVSTERSIKEEPETPREAPAPWEEQEEKPHLDQLHWRPPSNPHVKEEPSEELIERRPVGTGRQGAEEADHQRQRLILADAAAGKRPLKEECVTTNMFSSEKDSGRQNRVRPQRSQEDQATPEQKDKSKRTTSSTEKRVHPLRKPGVKAKTHTCDQCGKDYTRKSQLIRHQRTHSGEKPFKCDQCGKDFTRKSSFTNHQQVHDGEKPFKCYQCGKNFHIKSNLISHQQIHSGEKPIKCDQCGKDFICKTTLIRHQRIHSGEKPFKCDVCGKTFNQSGNLNLHVLTHRAFKAYKCEECEKTFTLRSHFLSHMKTHSGPELHRCDHCGKIYKQKQTLIRHLRSHTGHKVCVCDKCNKVFTTYQQLQRHQISHSSERPHKCDKCGKSYKMKCHLTDHQHVHKKESLEQGSSSNQTQMVTTPSDSSVLLFYWIPNSNHQGES